MEKFSVEAGIVNGERVWSGGRFSRFLLGRYPGHEIRATSTGQALSSASLSCRYSARGCRGIWKYSATLLSFPSSTFIRERVNEDSPLLNLAAPPVIKSNRIAFSTNFRLPKRCSLKKQGQRSVH